MYEGYNADNHSNNNWPSDIAKNNNNKDSSSSCIPCMKINRT